MHRNIGERTRTFFTRLGKKYRLLLPVAVIGLAVSMFICWLLELFLDSKIRLAILSFVFLLFMFSNSFAFPVFFSEESFLSDKDNIGEITKIDDSTLNLVDSLEVPESSLLSSEEDFDISEYGEVYESDIFSLEDILSEYDGSRIRNEEEDNNGFSKEDWRLVLINKQHPISDDYEFSLGTLSGNMQCDERIINDLLCMMESASKEGVSLVICSPYRDLEKQEKLFNRKINLYIKKGYSYLDAYKLSSQAVTVPGASEHQVGLAVDLISKTYTTLDEGFENTDAGKWLLKNCQDYGFILRYPKNKEYITSIEYEPWHFRYVGKDAAKVIMEENICLEEFWDKYL